MSSSSRSADRDTGTIGRARASAAERLAAAGVAASALEAAWLVEHVTGLTPAEQTLRRAHALEAEQQRALTDLVVRRAAREPLAYVLGATEFYGLRLELGPGVLVPRPESERLVELVLDELASRQAGDTTRRAGARVLEVGTGSGAIALAIAHALARSGGEVVASDVDDAALATARANADRLGLSLELHRSDLLSDPVVARRAARADVLVANLPYLPDAERATAPPELTFEPPSALYGGPDGLSVARRLVRQAAPTLRRGASLWLELDPRTVGTLALEASGAGWVDVRVERDLTGRERYLRLAHPPRSADAPGGRTASP